MSYYWFNRQELLQMIYIIILAVKKRAAEYYLKNKDVLKEKARNKYKNLSEAKQKNKNKNKKNMERTAAET